jgi:ferredoxin
VTRASDRVVIACSCDETMPLDGAALASGCGGTPHTATQLCGRELDRFKALVATGSPITVGCTHQAPLFSEIGEEQGAEERVTYVNVREMAGWSKDARAAGPKMAALLAAATESTPPVSLVSFESEGVALIYGRDETAIEAGRRLAAHLDVTVLLTKPAEVAPPHATEYPVLKGTIVSATGHLGAFGLRIDDYAVPAPSSRRTLAFAEARNGATSRCDLIVDVSGGLPLFAADELRSGYLRADPRDPAAVERVLAEASHLVGTFDKPKFIDFAEGLCAHSRSRITGCTRCLDVCPTGAITPAGNHVAIDPHVCAGCGSCAAVCPTGAASYALPPADALMRKLRTLLRAYRDAGGVAPVVLFHDGDHGEPLIHALARFGDGLPANVLPVRVNEVTQLGPETLAVLFAYGAVGARLLVRGRAKHDVASLHRTAGIVDLVLGELGYGRGVVTIIETDDPDALRAALDRAALGTPTARPAGFVAQGAKRNVLELAFRELRLAAPTPADVVTLPPGAPFGGLEFREDACTLCLACVGACPTHALSDNPDKPMLRFTESLCVQCGLCAATCPEDAISALAPRIDFAAWDAPKKVLKEEDPFHCTGCAKPFGSRGAIERVMAKLGDRHWMFSGADGQARLRVLTLCEDCRVEAVVNDSFDPHVVPERAKPRTTEDYLRDREAAKDS